MSHQSSVPFKDIPSSLFFDMESGLSGEEISDYDALNIANLKRLPLNQLTLFSDALRNFIVEIARERGGHYGAPLGVIELTTAVHYVFESPEDRIIWDTGHQAYAHKVITGRSWEMFNQRTTGGPAGFPVISESVHDAFGVGHASTSVAAAIGVSFTERMKTSRGWTVAVIGDAALAGGPALEALNLAGSVNSRICVILNDNAYSIMPNVGSLNTYRSHAYRSLLDAMGIQYYGPVDGHDPEMLADVLSHIRSGNTAAFVHAITVKGRGDSRAESDPLRLHMISPSKELESRSNQKSLQQVLAGELEQLGSRNRQIKVITPGMAAGAELQRFKERFPDQFFDTGIGEASATTIAGGIAASGDVPVLHIYSTFALRSADQIIHDIGLQKLSATLIIDRVGLSGPDGPTHHGIYDLAMLTVLPSWTVYSISSETSLRRLLRASLERRAGPVALRMSKGPGVAWGKLRSKVDPLEDVGFLRKEGTDLTILTHGRVSANVIDAVIQLETIHISCRIVEWEKLYPISAKDITHAILCGKPILIVEEHVATGSLGHSIAMISSAAGIVIPRMTHLCVIKPDVPHGALADQFCSNCLDSSSIFEAAKQLALAPSILDRC